MESERENEAGGATVHLRMAAGDARMLVEAAKEMARQHQEKEEQAFQVGMTDTGSRQDAHAYEVLAAEIAEAIAEA